MIISFIKVFISIYLMWKVSSSFDLAANFITKNMGDGIKGPTVNAVASSLPELMISFLFLFFYKDIEGFSAGYATIIGSSAFNIAIIPFIAFIFAYRKNKIKTFNINKNIVKQDGFFLLFSIILLGLGFVVGLNLYYALLLILTYFFYVLFIYKKRNTTKLKDKNKEICNIKFENGLSYTMSKSIINLRLFNLLGFKKINYLNSSLVILISVLIISLACYNLVIVVEEISNTLGINLFISAFFIAAISSSIPDTILSIKDAQHNKFNDSFSNTYGSNIFDICIGLGLPVFVYSIFYPPISLDVPIDRLGITNFGDNILGGDLIMWSLLILLIFTAIITLIYSPGKISFKNLPFIFATYFLYIIALIIF